ncbi:hypothetical protein B0T19DRAFT_446586 [Cercophora scortea]|uniref:Uncharacterized protein n=1 Tax=Cercophora scortea TaxID=314031 RepID=A0AAE0I4W4_9PEZI|nr:hypothetical protein B0T19DRAFT_446586 [Cercophora scortea]
MDRIPVVVYRLHNTTTAFWDEFMTKFMPNPLPPGPQIFGHKSTYDKISACHRDFRRWTSTVMVRWRRAAYPGSVNVPSLEGPNGLVQRAENDLEDAEHLLANDPEEPIFPEELDDLEGKILDRTHGLNFKVEEIQNKVLKHISHPTGQTREQYIKSVAERFAEIHREVMAIEWMMRAFIKGRDDINKSTEIVEQNKTNEQEELKDALETLGDRQAWMNNTLQTMGVMMHRVLRNTAPTGK